MTTEPRESTLADVDRIDTDIHDLQGQLDKTNKESSFVKSA
jgi:hypothetical protein